MSREIGTIRKTDRRRKMDKRNCAGCYNNGYSRGLGGAKECWCLEDARVIMRKEVHVDQRPPWNQQAGPFPNCYRRRGFVYVDPERTC